MKRVFVLVAAMLVFALLATIIDQLVGVTYPNQLAMIVHKTFTLVWGSSMVVIYLWVKQDQKARS